MKNLHFKFVCLFTFMGLEAILNTLHVHFDVFYNAFISNSAMLNSKPVSNIPKHIGN